jgi:general secretion pathway protein D
MVWKMKKFLLIVVLAFSSFANAANVSSDKLSLNFDKVPLLQFLETTYTSVVGGQYVIDPRLVDDSRRVSIHTKDMQKSEFKKFLVSVLRSSQIDLQSRDGIDYFLPMVVQNIEQKSVEKDVLIPPVSLQNSQQNIVAEIVPVDVTSDLYIVQNRSAEFIASVVNSVYVKTCTATGSNVLISGSEEIVKKALEIAKKIDLQAKKLQISASFVEVSSGDSDALGVSLLFNFLNTKFSGSLGSVSSGSALSVSGANFSMIVDALRSDSRFKQVSNPVLIVDENERGNISVGNDTPTVSGSTIDKAGNSIQQIVYRSSGVILDVLPRVFGSGAIGLLIDAQVSNFQTTTTGVSNSPTLIKRQVKTSLTMKNDEVILIGGLADQKSSDTNNGLSFLPKNWKINTSLNSKTDLVLVLTAKVIQ